MSTALHYTSTLEERAYTALTGARRVLERCNVPGSEIPKHLDAIAAAFFEELSAPHAPSAIFVDERLRVAVSIAQKAIDRESRLPPTAKLKNASREQPLSLGELARAILKHVPNRP